MLDDYSSSQDRKSKTTIFINVLLQRDWIKSTAAQNGENPQLKIWERNKKDSVWRENSSSMLHIAINDFYVLITIPFLFENGLLKFG